MIGGQSGRALPKVDRALSEAQGASMQPVTVPATMVIVMIKDKVMVIFKVMVNDNVMVMVKVMVNDKTQGQGHGQGYGHGHSHESP